MVGFEPIQTDHAPGRLPFIQMLFGLFADIFA
jgi:hypothetical protein